MGGQQAMMDIWEASYSGKMPHLILFPLTRFFFLHSGTLDG